MRGWGGVWVRDEDVPDSMFLSSSWVVPLQWYCEADGSVCGKERSPVSGQAHDERTGEG